MAFKNYHLIGALVGLLLTGCAAQQAYKDGQRLFQQGQIEEGLAQMDNAYRLDPDNREYRIQYYKHREDTVFKWLSQAESAKGEQKWEEAENIYQRILGIDAANPRAKVALNSLSAEKRQMQNVVEARAKFDAGEMSEAFKEVRSVLTDSPSNVAALKLKREIEARMALSRDAGTIFKSKLARPISIEYKDAPIRSVFDSIATVAGVNFIFDKEVRTDLRANFIVRDARIEDVIRFILVTNKLSERVLNGNTLFIYPNTPDKQQDFQELQIKSFYLTNASAKDVAVVIKGMVKPKEIHVDEKLNMIMLRDTAGVISVAERLIAAQDISEPEVMLEVEVLEVGSSLLDNIGIQYPSQLSYSLVGAAGTAGSAMLPELLNRNAGMVRVTLTDPALIFNMLHQDGETKRLANPKIRVKNHEKAYIHIGDKVPVISNVTTATGFVSQSINYLDVGLKLEVEPTIYLDNEVGIKIGLEVSNITKQIQNANGSLTYQIGTRNASTVLRLNNGETQILAGLISKDDHKSSNGIPLLGQLPIVGGLFSSRSEVTDNTEVVLLITPRVIRNIILPESPIEEFSSGSASYMSLDKFEINQADADEPKTLALAALKPNVQEHDAMAKPMGAQSAPPALGNRLVLNSPSHALIGESFTVKINLSSAGLQNALLNMSFDPLKLKLVSIAEGDLFKKPDGKTRFVQQVQEQTGLVAIGVMREGNVQGEGLFASVTFQPLSSASGETQFRIEMANFADASGRKVQVDALPTATVKIVK